MQPRSHADMPHAPTTIFDTVGRGKQEGKNDFTPDARDEAFTPTDAPPGSSEKIRVLQQRLAQGLPLWHADDTKDMTGISCSDVNKRRNCGRGRKSES